ncbi:MAG: hypothetical protein IPK64_17705 [bacterium]|nr:hypothetical protein [bacterium]
MRRATILKFLALGLPLLLAAAATAQSEPYSWSTSFDDDAQAGFVTADWNTTAGTLSLPPLVMTQAGSYSFTGGTDRDVAVDGRVVHALDGRELFCLDGGRPAQMPLLGRLYLGAGARAVAADDRIVVVAMGANGLRVVDARNPAAPVLSGTLPLPAALDVALTGRVAFVVDGVGLLHQVSLDNLAAPVLIESLPLGGTPNRIARDVNVTVVGLGVAGFTVMTSMTDAMPLPTATVSTAAPVLAVAVLGNRAFVTTSAAQLLVYDLGDPASPQLVATLPTTDACTAVRADADFVYAAGATRLERWHLPFGDQPQPAGTFATGSAVRDLVVSGRHAFLAGNSVLAVEPGGPGLVHPHLEPYVRRHVDSRPAPERGPAGRRDDRRWKAGRRGGSGGAVRRSRLRNRQPEDRRPDGRSPGVPVRHGGPGRHGCDGSFVACGHRFRSRHHRRAACR